MKLTVIGLIVLGVIAAGAAAVLIAMYNFAPPKQVIVEVPVEPEMVEILVAAHDLGYGEIVDGDAVARQSVSKVEVPENSVRILTDVVGKPIGRSLVKGQPFVSEDFMKDEHIVNLLRDGFRAFVIPIKIGSGIENFLYPGCYIDIIGNFKKLPKPGSDAPPEAAALTLLQRVQVLTVGRWAMSRDTPPANQGGGGTRWLTILVTPGEVEFLTLASSLGDLAVTLRPVLEAGETEMTGTTISRFSEDVQRHLFDVLRSTDTASLELPTLIQSAPVDVVESDPDAADEQMTVAEQVPLVPVWTTEIIRRGSDRELKEFEYEKEKDPAVASNSQSGDVK